MKIVFDCDGVLADFNTGFRQLAHDMFGTPVEVSDTFTWDNYGGGITEDQVDKIWRRINGDPWFWQTLGSLVDLEIRNRIADLGHVHDLYFVTSRTGIRQKLQTEIWLRQALWLEYPTVIVSNRKGEICAGIGADYCIDDKAGNAVYVAYHSKRTKSYLLDAPYNRFDQTALGTRVRRVKSVTEYLDDIEAGR